MLHVRQTIKEKSSKAGEWELPIPIYIFSEKKPERIMEKELLRTTENCRRRYPEHTVRTADNNFLHRKFISSPIEFQRSPKEDLSPDKHKLRGPGGKYVSASKVARLMKEGIISESKPKVRKVDVQEEGSDFECYDRSDGKPVHVHIDKERTKGNTPTLAFF